MKIIGLEKLSLVDYDGHTACTLFTGGCNFRCPFCHNGDLVLNHELFESYSEDYVFSYLKKRQGLLDGVVVTGGEPTLYRDLPDYIRKIKALGYDVKLDTNGTNPEMLLEIIERHLIDYVAVDVKSSKEGYAKATGLKSFPEKVAQTVELLKTNVIDYEFRTTLVDELINEKDIIEIAEWLKSCKVLFLQRFIEREGCIEKGLHEVSKTTALHYLDILEKKGINAKLRNYD